MFALLIGVNVYRQEEFRVLRGAVADVADFKSYLENDLNVPFDHIQVLTDENATRQNILNALISLRDDPRINWGDAILIYYAGHGAEVEAPLLWRNDKGNKVKGILPHDFDPQGAVSAPLQGL